ncbi:MAG: phospholipid/cholesterol/gamma-HCH transport system permease protein [Chlamydiales bacterium]|jgi:phospholipid/cholesterol/gamma-HCH transport system permease protein
MDTGPARLDSGPVTVPGFQIEDDEDASRGTRLLLRGSLSLSEAGHLRRELAERLRSGKVTTVDLSGVVSLDSSAASILADVCCQGSRAGDTIQFQGASGAVQAILSLYTDRVTRASLRSPPVRIGIFEHLGQAAVGLCDRVRELLTFLGEFFDAVRKAVRAPSTVNWPDVGRLIERHGSDGVPIVLLITFLVGLVTAFQAAIQLRKFGADTFIADMVSLSITRELGPLMAAIVVAGRSGAAIAAELGTMKVSEEIDALRTIGLCPQRFLVFPRVIALIFVMPILTLLADVVGIAGGLFVAVFQLGIPIRGYLISVQEALSLWDVTGGLLKALIFGALIAVVGSERGLATRGGAEGVGRSTTGAVVTILFYLILADAIFTVLFQSLGI